MPQIVKTYISGYALSARWIERWKDALNAFENTFDGRLWRRPPLTQQ